MKKIVAAGGLGVLGLLAFVAGLALYGAMFGLVLGTGYYVFRLFT